jgi:hypothetical protein
MKKAPITVGPLIGRRLAVLYSAGELFACRHCHRLACASQNETPFLRSIRRARKIRMRLGASPSHFPPSRRECTGELTYRCEQVDRAV